MRIFSSFLGRGGPRDNRSAVFWALEQRQRQRQANVASRRTKHGARLAPHLTPRDGQTLARRTLARRRDGRRVVVWRKSYSRVEHRTDGTVLGGEREGVPCRKREKKAGAPKLEETDVLFLLSPSSCFLPCSASRCSTVHPFTSSTRAQAFNSRLSAIACSAASGE